MPVRLGIVQNSKLEPGAKLWRYMDLGKFLHIVQSGGLFFPTLETLTSDDPSEGSYPASNVEMTLDKYTEMFSEIPFIGPDGPTEPDYDLISFLYESEPARRTTAKIQRRYVIVSCWHASEHESDAMWKLYGRMEGAVAIVTKVKSFVSAFEGCPRDIWLNSTIYLDFDTDSIPPYLTLYPWLFKRKSYKSEQEARAFLAEPMRLSEEEASGAKEHTHDPFGGKGGETVPCDINTLIEEVYISPRAPQYILEVVSKICDTYGLNVKPKQSRLYDPGLF